jgi:subtilisin family serine protease
VVELDAPPLARAVASSRALSSGYKQRRLSLRAPTSVAYLEGLRREQAAVATRIERTIAGAHVRWRYAVVLNGLAVTLPHASLPALRGVAGVARVVASTRYTASLDRSAAQIGAPALWSADLSSAGNGVKIGILDDGVDQRHPFFSPAGYVVPAGFPKGQTTYTTAKVIVARAFPPARPRWRHAGKPFDPELSEHGTHVAGIAAGNSSTASVGRTRISGVAPRAYVGNYKVLTVPTAGGVGINGNSPEIVAGIEAAVADGMDVINLSLGEPEIEPTRDIVARALDAAMDAGVVVAVAAGNDGDEFGAGSISSPGTSAKAISVGAVSTGTEIAAFSSVGPTPLSLRLKPDLAAPGLEILSSVPERAGSWARFSGTSMAAPHVAGAAALLVQRHPEWTPEQVKSALVQTARPLGEAPTRAGAGMVDVAGADRPLLFASPTSVSFGLVRRGAGATATVALADAGGGSGTWTVSVDRPADAAVTITALPEVAVPGSLPVQLATTASASPRVHTGAIVLRRGADVRRIAFWVRVTAPRLAAHRETPLRRPGAYRGDTRGRPALVAQYRYPEAGSFLPGPEQVFRVRIARPVANFGVVVTSRASGVTVQPRIVHAGDENRLVGYTALPLNLNPYLASFGARPPASGAVLPRPGAYDIVFDTPAGGRAGRFAFRYWVNDLTPPRLRLLARSVRRGRPLRIAASDRGSGVYPGSLVVRVDQVEPGATFRGGVISVRTDGLAPGTHRLVLQVSDYQETRNMENVARILPNTARLETTFRVTG